jgi:3-isopropylmalate dehydratase small subunit
VGTESLGGVAERFPDVGSLKVWVGAEDLVGGHAFASGSSRQHAYNGGGRTTG